MVSAVTAPILTLSIGGVDFCLEPHPNEETNNGASNVPTVSYRHVPDEVCWTLTAFTGTLRVRARSPDAFRHTTDASSVPCSVTTRSLPNEPSLPAPHVTPRMAHSSSFLATKGQGNDPPSETRKRSHRAGEKKSRGDTVKRSTLDKRQRTQPSSSDEELVVLGDCQPTASSLPTLLGQPDFSQTQRSVADELDDSLTPEDRVDDSDDAQPSKVKQLMQQASSNCSVPSPSTSHTAVKDNDQGSVRSLPSFVLEDDDDDCPATRDRSTAHPWSPSADETRLQLVHQPASMKGGVRSVATNPARVSLGTPSKPAGPPQSQAPPCPRWGHTFTYIGDQQYLVYGGQTWDATTGLPQTLRDVAIYHASKKTWFTPLNCDGFCRQWHTATYLPERQLLISFGGEAASPKTGKTKTTHQVMVLDTEIMLWYPPTVSGDVPSGRSGHTATRVVHASNDTELLVVFGGVQETKWLNTVSVLDTTRWCWSTPKTTGAAPKPRSYHTATAVRGNIVVLGGNNATQAFNTVHVLEPGSQTWTWTHPQVRGRAPVARTGHSTTLLADGKTLCVYGGWDPNDEAATDDAEMIFQDCFLLDTETWTWSQPTGETRLVHEQGTNGGARRVGHAAILDQSQPDRVVLFGGRVPGDQFSGDLQSLSVRPTAKEASRV